MPVSLVDYLEGFLERREACRKSENLRPHCAGEHDQSCVIAVRSLTIDEWTSRLLSPLRKMFFAWCVPDQHTWD